MKNNIDFYQHYANADQHPKFKMLRVKYGWEGEGKFWALNNRIALAENCMLNISKKYNVSTIAHDLGFDTNELKNYIDFLANECELIIKEDGYITTEIIQENLDRVMKKRKKNKSDYNQRSVRFLQSSESEIQTSEKIQSKVKERKVKKTYPFKFDKKVSIPDGYHFTQDIIEYAKEIGFDGNIKDFEQTFILSCQSNGYKYKDFHAAPKNWMRKRMNNKKSNQEPEEPDDSIFRNAPTKPAA